MASTSQKRNHRFKEESTKDSRSKHNKSRSPGELYMVSRKKQENDSVSQLLNVLLLMDKDSGRMTKILGNLVDKRQLKNPKNSAIFEIPHYHPNAVARQRDQDRIYRDNKSIDARLKEITKQKRSYNKDTLLVEYERQVTSLLPASYFKRYVEAFRNANFELELSDD